MFKSPLHNQKLSYHLNTLPFRKVHRLDRNNQKCFVPNSLNEFDVMNTKVSKDIIDGSKNAKKSAFNLGKIKPAFANSDKSKKGDS